MTTPQPDPPPVFPDVEALLVEFLSQRPELEGVDVGVEPAQPWPPDRPVLIVTRTGGSFTHYQRLDTALVRVASHANGRTEAHRNARVVRALLGTLVGSTRPGARVHDVAEEQGPALEPDEDHPGTPRYTLRQRITVSPGPDADPKSRESRKAFHSQ
ncbi:hypothetical protein FHX37_3596 [Haloactinospora alba]|uniref:Uncharacterized protein n=1 Tax=Haloactinospora alba TaxID=405555 RepID=A0A543NNZ5_9ACTN|nr:hypothetical protein [Haloactinospora alba]TQN33570.1 hypothetical protein FHX37_3596 [Haloactinospora alba]